MAGSRNHKLEHKDRKLLSLTFMFHEAFAETFSGKEVSARGYFDFRTSFYRGWGLNLIDRVS